MKSEHTPGPWLVDKYGVITGGTNGCTSIATTPLEKWRSTYKHYRLPSADIIMTSEANGHLIAAAPDLLHACEQALVDIEAIQAGRVSLINVCESLICELKTAIAKVKSVS